MLSKEQSIFLNILSDHINGRKTDIQDTGKKTAPLDEFDRAGLLSIARSQQCEGIVYSQTRLPEYKSAFAYCSFYRANQKKTLSKVYAAFSEADIPYLIFKGSEIADFYPVPQLRTMTDSDILVRPQDKEKAHKALESMGFPRIKKTWMEWIYKKDVISVELHHRLLYDEPANTEKEKKWADSVWEHAKPSDGTQYKIEPEYHFVFALVHLKKHFLHSGVGFRQFMDIAVLGKRELDWNTVTDYIEKLDLSRFASTVFSLIKYWFGITMPICTELQEPFINKITENIFNGGVFGFDDEKNDVNSITNSLIKKSKAAVILETVFPSYTNMCTCDEYAFLRGHPYLLPAAWVYRFVRSISKKKVKSGFREVNLSVTREKEIEERKNYLKEWGLL